MISITLLVLAVLVIALSYPAKKYNDKLVNTEIITQHQWLKNDIRIEIGTFLAMLILCIVSAIFI